MSINSEWINSRDKLPEDGVEVIALARFKYVNSEDLFSYAVQSVFLRTKGWSVALGEDYLEDVLGWIPIPEGPF